jgi:formylglycine-generating enzyme required for sulfatase activity
MYDVSEMIVIQQVEFMMGSPAEEAGRFSSEGPQHKVTIANPFAIARCPVTRREFAKFVDATGYRVDGGAYVWDDEEWNYDSSKSWCEPGFPQDDQHPVVCVNWVDVQGYIRWMREKTSMPYRLPSEAEWECAARAGTVTPFWWGGTVTPDQANYNGNFDYEGQQRKGVYRRGTVPVESFMPNPWGLFQVHGNVREWLEDVWHDKYFGAPTDGSAWIDGDDEYRVVRGGSWNYTPWYLRSASRFGFPATVRNGTTGFRLARTLSV